MTLATDAGTATFQASDGLVAHNITITATVDYSGRTIAIAGTRLDGTVATDSIVGPSANGVASGTVPFQSVSSIYFTTAGPTDTVAVGIGRIFALAPTRVVSIRLALATDSGTLTLRNSQTVTGELEARLIYPATPSTVNSMVYEDFSGAQGVRFSTGLYADFTSGIRGITLYYG